MTEDFQLQLQELGLLPDEAQVYTALVRNGALGGSAIAGVTGFPRSSVYLTLNSLLDKDRGVKTLRGLLVTAMAKCRKCPPLGITTSTRLTNNSSTELVED